MTHVLNDPAHNNFMRLAANLQAGDIDFDANGGDSDSMDLDTEKLIVEKPLQQANSVSSRVALPKFKATDDDPLVFTGYMPTGMHKIVIDLDMDAALIPTSTPGHHHLIIDHQLSWTDYRGLLVELKRFGLIEPGYLRACVAREASWIRTPWTRKA